MKRVILGVVTCCLVVVAVAVSGNQQPLGNGDLQVQVEERNPWTHLRVNGEPENFHFVVTSDRTGGHRARVFSQAVEQINLLQPAFVLSVGDLIEGYTKDPKQLEKEWKEFQGYVCKLKMPFFYVSGNHDISNTMQEKHWQERFGRRYYHFVFRNVLFLLLSSDNPSHTDNKETGELNPEQIAYAQKVLKENEKVRWTIVCLHKPIWNTENVSKNGWLEVEKALAGRNYTVFCGHVHRYQKFVRQGQNYYQLSTTGGSSKMRGVKYGEFDHITWVTMQKDGPIIANVTLDGIYNESMQQPVSAEEGYVRRGMKPVNPVRGTVTMDGTAIPYARVVFYSTEGKKAYTSDAIAHADGSFEMSTYSAFDGVPAGEYLVTVVSREPYYDLDGKLGPNRLPAQFASPNTTPLRAQVATGPNQISFNLKK